MNLLFAVLGGAAVAEYVHTDDWRYLAASIALITGAALIQGIAVRTILGSR